MFCYLILSNFDFVSNYKIYIFVLHKRLISKAATMNKSGLDNIL